MPNLEGAILVDSFDEIEEIEKQGDMKENMVVEDSVIKKRLVYSRRKNY